MELTFWRGQFSLWKQFYPVDFASLFFCCVYFFWLNSEWKQFSRTLRAFFLLCFDWANYAIGETSRLLAMESRYKYNLIIDYLRRFWRIQFVKRFGYSTNLTLFCPLREIFSLIVSKIEKTSNSTFLAIVLFLWGWLVSSE
jgi:hypothetical protein